MNTARRTFGMVAAAALLTAVVPSVAQADESAKVVSSDLRLQSTTASVASVAGLDATDPFFAGHGFAAGDSEDAEVNTAIFVVHSWECGAETEGVLSAILTFDNSGFFNGGPGIFMSCDAGVQAYEPVFLDYAEGTVPASGAVAGGDKVRMSVVREAGAVTYTLENLTQGWTESFVGTGDWANRFIQTGDNSITVGGIDVPPPAFGRDPVKQVHFDAMPLSTAGSTRYNMVTEDGSAVVERATRYLDNRHGQRFALIKRAIA